MTSALEQSVIDGSAWAEFCDQLKAAGDLILAGDFPDDALNRAEGFRYLTRLTRRALEGFIECNDPLYPVLFRPAHETVKMGSDNPDNYYEVAAIRGDRDYRIRGTRGTVSYLSFETKASNYDKDQRLYPTGHLEARDLELGPNGELEIIVSATEKPGNWLPMRDDSEMLLVRQTFERRDEEDRARITVECLDGAAAPKALDAESFARNLKSSAAFVRGTAALFASWSREFRPWHHRLQMLPHERAQAVGGDPEIRYYYGYYDFAPDEALVIESPVPPCKYWNFHLDNFWLESLDYRYHPICLNNGTASLEADGSIRIVVAHEDLGQPNWISTAGHPDGFMCFRWVGADAHPTPALRVVKLKDL